MKCSATDYVVLNSLNRLVSEDCILLHFILIMKKLKVPLLSCSLFANVCIFRKSHWSLTVSGPGPLRGVLFRNCILVHLSQVDVSVWCIMINSAQVSPPLRKAWIDVLQTKAIHQLCVLGFDESVPNHALLLGSMVMTPFCVTPQEINARYTRSLSSWKAT